MPFAHLKPRFTLYVLTMGMTIAVIGVSVAMTLFLVNGHTTSDVCKEIENNRSQLCELDGSVDVSLPTLSFTGVLDPERLFFIISLSLASILIGASYIGIAELYRGQIIEQQKQYLSDAADSTPEGGTVASLELGIDSDVVDIHRSQGCICCSLETIGWPLCWVRPPLVHCVLLSKLTISKIAFVSFFLTFLPRTAIASQSHACLSCFEHFVYRIHDIYRGSYSQRLNYSAWNSSIANVSFKYKPHCSCDIVAIVYGILFL